jgi:hypothetical protein
MDTDGNAAKACRKRFGGQALIRTALSSHRIQANWFFTTEHTEFTENNFLMYGRTRAIIVLAARSSPPLPRQN